MGVRRVEEEDSVVWTQRKEGMCIGVLKSEGYSDPVVESYANIRALCTNSSIDVSNLTRKSVVNLNNAQNLFARNIPASFK